METSETIVPESNQVKRKLVIETDGNVINIKESELSILELREIGRQLMNIR